jgi:hypothetical protein
MQSVSKAPFCPLVCTAHRSPIRRFRGETYNSFMLRKFAISAMLVGAIGGLVHGCQGPQVKPMGAYPIPEQVRMGTANEISMGRYSLKPQATYRIHAYVMARENYRTDALADLVPLDLALAWGPAATPQVQDAIEVTQSRRWYFWKPKSREAWSGLPQGIERSMANVHIIPADRWIARELESIRPGDTVELRGKLVDIMESGHAIRTTSLSRDDQGGGACEILLVDWVMKKKPAAEVASR